MLVSKINNEFDVTRKGENKILSCHCINNSPRVTLGITDEDFLLHDVLHHSPKSCQWLRTGTFVHTAWNEKLPFEVLK